MISSIVIVCHCIATLILLGITKICTLNMHFPSIQFQFCKTTQGKHWEEQEKSKDDFYGFIICDSHTHHIHPVTVLWHTNEHCSGKTPGSYNYTYVYTVYVYYHLVFHAVWNGVFHNKSEHGLFKVPQA